MLLFISKYLPYVLRIINVVISWISASYVFNYLTVEYAKYLPNEDVISQFNNPTASTSSSMMTLLVQNLNGLRELYFHTLEKTYLYSFLTFILTFLLVEYIYHSRDRQIIGAIKSVYTHLGAWQERQKISREKQTDLSKENESYIRDFMSKK